MGSGPSFLYNVLAMFFSLFTCRLYNCNVMKHTTYKKLFSYFKSSRIKAPVPTHKYANYLKFLLFLYFFCENLKNIETLVLTVESLKKTRESRSYTFVLSFTEAMKRAKLL